MNKYEQETVVVLNDAEDEVRIYAAQRPFMNRIRNDERFTITQDNGDDLHAVISRKHWTPWGGLKRRYTMTDEQKAQAAERLRQVREGKQ